MTRMGWGQLTSILVGGAICLPVIMVGQTLAESYGFWSSIWALMIGNALLLPIALGVVGMAVRYRQNTVANTERFLGRKGMLVFFFVSLLPKLGWIAMGLQLMGESLAEVTGLPPQLSSLLLGGAMTAVVLGGIRSVGRLASLSVPLMIGTMVAALYFTGFEPVGSGDSLSAATISLVIAVSITSVFNFPTFFMHARSRRDAMISVALVFGLALPLIEGVGVYLSTQSPGQLLFMREGHPLWNIWICFFIVVAGWTTNNNNLYGAEVGLRVLLPKWSPAKTTMVLGIIGTMLSLLPLLSNLTFLLNLLGVGAGTVGAVILTRYLIGGAMTYGLHGVSWGLGAAIGLLTTFNLLSITGVPVLDAVMVGSLSVIVGHLASRVVRRFSRWGTMSDSRGSC